LPNGIQANDRAPDVEVFEEKASHVVVHCFSSTA
jgi:hypothetical protein